MTSAQRLALASAFERLAARITAQPVVRQHPIVERRKAHRVTASRRGTHRREEKYIEA